MSTKRLSQSSIKNADLPITNKNNWVRPSDWVAMPDVNKGDNMFAGVYAVFDLDSEFCSLRMSCTGGYTVDWGDGTSTTHATNTTAQHQYTYSSITNAITSKGYKTVLVKAYPTIAGNTITNLDLSLRSTLTTSFTPRWLDIFAYSSYSTIATIILSPNTATTGGSLTLLERLIVDNFKFTHNNNFNFCSSIQVLSYLDFSDLTSMQSLFSSCTEIEYLPPIKWGTITSTSNGSAFLNCSKLKEINYLPTPTVYSTLISAFQGCGSLQKISNVNFKPNSLQASFSGCGSLVKFENCTFDLSQCTTMSSAFNSCSSLLYPPDCSTTSVSLTLLASCFANCYSLRECAVFGVTSNVTTYANMYQNCYSLSIAKDLNYNVNSCTTVSSMFSNCYALSVIDNPFSGTFPASFVAGGFSSFATAGIFSSSALNKIRITQSCPTTINALSSTFPTANSLARLDFSGLNQTFSIATNVFSATELNNLYTSLATVTGKTITVTSNWGTATDNPAIATAKGWTVTG